MTAVPRRLYLLLIFIPLFLMVCMAACVGLVFVGIRRLELFFNF
jgi:hypothetical protein